MNPEHALGPWIARECSECAAAINVDRRGAGRPRVVCSERCSGRRRRRIARGGPVGPVRHELPALNLDDEQLVAACWQSGAPF